MTITLFYDATQTRYFLGGSVATFPEHLYIKKRIALSFKGSVSDEGVLKNARLCPVNPDFDVANYRVSYSGSLSETQGSGTWSDNHNCSGTWDLSKN